MRARTGTLLTIGAMLVAACGGGQEAEPSNVAPSSTTPSSSTTSPAAATIPPKPATTIAPTAEPAPTTEPLPATTEPAPTTTEVEAPITTQTPTSDGAVLRTDGIGPYDFGTEIAVVGAWISTSLGAPEVIEDGGLVVCVRWGCSETAMWHWPAAGLYLGSVDRTDDGTSSPEPLFAAWAVSSETWYPGRIFSPGTAWSADAVEVRLTTTEGIGLGSTVAEIATAIPPTGFRGWHDGAFQPTGFYVTDADDRVVLEGDLDWDVVSEIQAALNAGGAELSVDGLAGPATQAALAEFQDGLGLVTVTETLDALGIRRPSPDAHVVRLSSVGWFWEFECGEMEIFGFDDRC